MNARKLLTAFAVAMILNAAGFSAFAGPVPTPSPSSTSWAESESDERAEREADLYEEGTDAIDDEQWEEAIRHFTRVAEMKGSKADGAIYWTAYALS